MKKVFLTLAVVAVAALGMTSCKDSSEARCWKVTYKSAGVEIVNYTWMSEDTMNATYGKFTDFKAEKVSGTEGDCIDLQNEKGGGSINF